MSDVTELVELTAGGDPHAPARLFEAVYAELRRLADRYLRGDGAARSLQPTELVHEMYLRISAGKRVDWRGRTHFFAVGARVMRRILVDRARARGRTKRGGGSPTAVLDDSLAVSPERDWDVLALDELLADLQEVDARQAQIVELRFFGGLNVQEVADVLGLSKRTVEAEWTIVRAWLRRELSSRQD